MVKIKGFTLIELMVVIAIVGILVALVVPKFTEYNHPKEVQELGSYNAMINGTMHKCNEYGDCIPIE